MNKFVFCVLRMIIIMIDYHFILFYRIVPKVFMYNVNIDIVYDIFRG